MKRFWWVLIGILVGGVACGNDTASSSQEQNEINTYIKASNNPGELTDDEFDVITVEVNGREMPCVVWKDRRESADAQYAYSGLTCDWSPR